MSSPDPCRCPLCGRPNQCGMAAGKGNCWCFTRTLSPEVLEKLSGETRDRACVCETCATGVRDASGIFEQMREILSRH